MDLLRRLQPPHQGQKAVYGEGVVLECGDAEPRNPKHANEESQDARADPYERYL